MRERISAKYFRLWMGETTFDYAVPPRRGRHNREYMAEDEGQPNNENMDNHIRNDGDDDINEDDSDEDQEDEEPTGLDDDDEFVLPIDIWERIAQDMHTARTTVPAVNGRPPRDLSKYFRSFHQQRIFGPWKPVWRRPGALSFSRPPVPPFPPRGYPSVL